MAEGEGKWWAPLNEFAVHSLVGTLAFVLIAGLAVLLDYGIRQLSQFEVSAFVLYCLKGGEYALLVTDLVLFVIFLVQAGRKLVRKL